MMIVMGNGKRPFPRFIGNRCLELRDGGKHGQHGHCLLSELDACAGDDFRTILLFCETLLVAETPDHLEQAHYLFTVVSGEICRHALGHISLGNRIGLRAEGRPAEACGQRLVDGLDFLNQQTVLNGIGESRLVGIGPAALADRLDFDETRHRLFRKRGNGQ
ncbi:hypothetical protein D9M72_525150 [compost metagenome]